MCDWESNVATYLTLDGKVFIAPQFAIAYDKDRREGGSCPDFVALDLENKEIIVVEVTANANINTLLKNIRERETRWYQPILRKLEQTAITASFDKTPRFLGFVRKDVLKKAEEAFPSAHDITFVPLEDVAFSWFYWDKRIEGGLPRGIYSQNHA